MPKWTQNEMENAIKSDQEDQISMERAGTTYRATYTTLNNKLTCKYCNFNGAPTASIMVFLSRFYGTKDPLDL